MGFQLTDEQVTAVDLSKNGGSLAIEALAGSGKTSTLLAIANELGGKGYFTAFNAKICDEAATKFPPHVTVLNAHKMALRSAVGSPYRRRLGGRRLYGQALVKAVGVRRPLVFGDGEETITLAPARIASLVMQTIDRFCQSADTEITTRHVPRVDRLDAPGEWENNNALSELLLPMALDAWAEVSDPNGGRVPFSHGVYLKMFALSGTRLPVDYLLVDEAQDLSPVLGSIVAAQDCQVICVGDSQQSIYGFTGARNYLGETEFDGRTYLTRSFRFGPEIAEVANVLLRRLGSPMMVEGVGPAGWVGEVGPRATMLGRNNATVVRHALGELGAGRVPHIVGGTSQVTSFAKAAGRLQGGQTCDHPDLAEFDSWGAVEQYVENDELGADLKTMVNLVNTFGPHELVRRLEALPSSEAGADSVCSTAHKAKGVEWDEVKIGGDFGYGADVDPEELRLMYVAVTRAQRGLDVSDLDFEGVLAKVKMSERAEAIQDLRTSPRIRVEPPTPKEWAVPCGYCGVDEGRPCRTKTGGDMRLDYVHVARTEALEAKSELAAVS